MARGRTPAAYESDILGHTYVRSVPNHLYGQAGFGWAADPGDTVSIPHTMKPRHVVGKETNGRTHTAVVATTSADIWTRTVATWTIKDEDGGSQTVTATGLVGEAYSFSS